MNPEAGNIYLFVLPRTSTSTGCRIGNIKRILYNVIVIREKPRIVAIGGRSRFRGKV